MHYSASRVKQDYGVTGICMILEVYMKGYPR